MLNQEYDLELEKVITEIRKRNAKKVLIQLGEGLKPRANEIQHAIDVAFNLESEECKVYFWLNSCYGKCDIPDFIDSKYNDIDLLIQFGH